MTSLDFRNINYSHYPTSPPNYPMLISVNICNTLGLLCIFLNLFVVYALLRNRRRVLANVFYVLVLHCAFVDLIRGTCLVAWGMPNLLINRLNTVQDRLLLLKINQFTLIVLRSCNFLTIFNLLVFTTNEFIVIKFPLHYRRYFRRRTVLVILGCSWLISVLFGVGSVFSNFFPSAHSVLVLNNGTAYLRGKAYSRGPGLTRREMDGVSINVICMLMIFVLCYLCLVIVLICYGTILRTIRQFHSGDTKGKFHNEESQKFNRSTMHSHQCSSQKCIEIDKEGRSTVVSNGNSVQVPNDSSAKTSTASQPFSRCNSHRKWRTHLMSRHKYLIVIGSVLFVDILFLFPYSGIQLVAFLQINKLLDLSPKSSLIRYGFQILIGIHSVCQPLCYFRMNEFRRLACCCAQPKISRSKSFSQSKEGLASNDEETNTPLQSNPRAHQYQQRIHKLSTGSHTDPINKRLRHHHQKDQHSVGPVRRLSRLISQSLMDSETESDYDERAPDLVLPAVTVIVPNEQIEDPELPHTPTESELEHILDCGLGSPFLETNWNRVVGASLRFRGGFNEDEANRHKLSTLSDMRSSTCFERESFCLPSEAEDDYDEDEPSSRRNSALPQ
uniref:G_PROTEIN_RECEP_F1_2 domain-containing protein n=1 Tax=Bursaphelenchus xylophilus TaxID=6326 RepID=A0A1I7S8H2_BURXY